LAGAQSLPLSFPGSLRHIRSRLNDRFGPTDCNDGDKHFFRIRIVLMSKVPASGTSICFMALGRIGMSTVDVIALSTTARWFVRRRNMMTGIVKEGAGVGQLVIPFVGKYACHRIRLAASLHHVGYFCHSYAYWGGTSTAARPLSNGGSSDGNMPNRKRGVPHQLERAFSSREASKTRQFWMICSTNLIIMFCLMIILLHIVPHARTMGHPA